MDTNYVNIPDILADPASTIGKPFHYECNMGKDDSPMGRALNEMAMFLNSGNLDIMSIDGFVIFCNEGYAVIKVLHTYAEFGVYLFTYDDTTNHFPGFVDKNRLIGEGYLWLSLEDGWFVPIDPALLDADSEVPQELENSVMELYKDFKKMSVRISLPQDDLSRLKPDSDEILSHSINRTTHWMEKTDCAILTAWRKDKPRAVNDTNNHDLQVALRDHGFGVIKVRGVYESDKENSFITFSTDVDSRQQFYETVFILSKQYEQDCFLYKEAGLASDAYLIGTNEDWGIGRKEKIGLISINEMDPEAYSKVGSGTISFIMNN